MIICLSIGWWQSCKEAVCCTAASCALWCWMQAGQRLADFFFVVGELLTLPAVDVSYCRCSLFLIVLLVLLSVVSVCLQGPHHTCGHHLEAQAG